MSQENKQQTAPQLEYLVGQIVPSADQPVGPQPEFLDGQVIQHEHLPVVTGTPEGLPTAEIFDTLQNFSKKLKHPNPRHWAKPGIDRYWLKPDPTIKGLREFTITQHVDDPNVVTISHPGDGEMDSCRYYSTLTKTGAGVTITTIWEGYDHPTMEKLSEPVTHKWVNDPEQCRNLQAFLAYAPHHLEASKDTNPVLARVYGAYAAAQGVGAMLRPKRGIQPKQGHTPKPLN
jgi:hypothetical protein